MYYELDNERKMPFIKKGEIFKLEGIYVDENPNSTEVYLKRVHPVTDISPDSISFDQFKNNFFIKHSKQLTTVILKR